MPAKVDLRQWLQQKLGKRIEKHGPEWAIPCPECDIGREKEWRLWFNVEKGVGTCYKCHKPFNALRLVQALEGVSLAEALRLLKDHVVGGVLSMAALKQKVEQAFDEEKKEKTEVLKAIDLPAGFRLAEDVPQRKWPEYLKRIGSPKTITNYGIGWCPIGYFRNRMVVPVALHGEVLFFIARDMTGKADRKVLYPKGSKTSRVLFNYDRAKHFEQVVLVEGVLDALRVGPRGMAVFGTSLSDTQVDLLSKSSAREVVLMFDGDEAGEDGMEKVGQRLRSMFKVRVVRLPKGKDPDDFSRERLRKFMDAAPYIGRGSDLSGHVRRMLARS